MKYGPARSFSITKHKSVLSHKRALMVILYDSVFGKRLMTYWENIPILPEAFLTFTSKSCGPFHAAH